MHGSRDPARKVREPGSGTNGTVTTTLGGDGGPSIGARWDRHGGAGDRNLSVDDRARDPGDESWRDARAGPDAQAGRWPQEGDRQGRDAGDGLGGVGRADGLWRSSVSTALDVEERAPLGGGAPGAGAHGKPPSGRRSPAGRRLQPAGEPEDPRGPQHPDRDAQFRYINEQVRRYQKRAQPAISVDTKKKELVGDFKNTGRERSPKGAQQPVRVHDFVIPEQGKAIPYGVYDLHRNEGWVSVGIDHDTASFAVHAIRRWWKLMGRAAYGSATSLLITADSGGSNGSRGRPWKGGLRKVPPRT